MKKTILLILVLTFTFSIASSFNISVIQQNIEPVYIIGTGDSIYFNLSIKNNGATSTINLYNLVGFEMTPKERFTITSEETKNILVELKPLREINNLGHYSISYYIRESDEVQREEFLHMYIMNLEDAFEIGLSELDPASNTFNLYVRNKIDYPFKDLNIKFSSRFFELQKNFDLSSNEKKEFEVTLNRENFKKLLAGFYTLEAEIKFKDIIGKIEKPIKFVEKDIIETSEENKGIFILEKIILKENKGNIISNSHTVVKKNIVSRLFSTFNPKPTSVDRDGLIVYYTWINNIEPGNQQKIIIKTNWFFPILIIIFIIAIVIFAKQYSNSDLILRKRAGFVKAKGGEFGIKVSIIIKAKKYVENITITERLPALVKLYERFGNEQPSRVDEKKRKIEWNIDKLEEGENRVISYVVYSKLGVIGKFALPKAFAIYQKNGEVKETSSNRTFFIAEQTKDLEVY